MVETQNFYNDTDKETVLMSISIPDLACTVSICNNTDLACWIGASLSI